MNATKIKKQIATNQFVHMMMPNSKTKFSNLQKSNAQIWNFSLISIKF